MLLVKPERDGEHARDRGDVEGALVAADARPDPVHQPGARTQHDRGGCDRQQRAQRPFAFRAEEQHAVQRGGRRPGKRGKRRAAVRRGRHAAHTRSLDFSAIRPVGRQAMMAMMTASANTSL